MPAPPTPEPAPEPDAPTSPHPHWRANRRAMAVLLAVWFAVPCLLGIVFVEPLNAIRLGGFPLGFWFAQQGAIYVFVVLVAIYAVWMDRIDRRYAGRGTGGGGGAGEDDAA